MDEKKVNEQELEKVSGGVADDAFTDAWQGYTTTHCYTCNHSALAFMPSGVSPNYDPAFCAAAAGSARAEFAVTGEARCPQYTPVVER